MFIGNSAVSAVRCLINVYLGYKLAFLYAKNPGVNYSRHTL